MAKPSDEIVSYISPKNWLVLGAAFLLIAFIFIWAVFAKIPLRVEGFGILLFRGVLTEVVAPVEGTLVKQYVGTGDVVKTGQLMMQISAEGLKDVRAPVDGRVMESLASPIAAVKKGAPLFILSTDGQATKDLRAMFFVSAIDSKRIRPGMKAELIPLSVREETHGRILGEVSYVGVLPTSARTMQANLKLPELVKLVQKNVPMAPTIAYVEPLLDDRNATGYAWSSNPPNHVIEPGTFAKAYVIVDEIHPIDYIWGY